MMLCLHYVVSNGKMTDEQYTEKDPKEGSCDRIEVPSMHLPSETEKPQNLSG
jgi:hypothetical protein